MRTKQIALLIVMSICIALLATSVFALTLKVKTLSDHRISIIIREAEKLTPLESFHKDTGTGELEITSTAAPSSLDILVTLKKDGQNIISRKYESVNNENLFLLFIPGDDKLMTQAEVDAESTESPETETAETTEATQDTAKTTETTSETEEVQETEKETLIEETKQEPEKTTSTGFALLDMEKMLGNTQIIKTGLGILVLVGLLMMIWMFFMRKKEENFTVRPWSEVKQELRIKSNPTSHQVAEIEQKMKALQSELENIKNKDHHVQELKERYKRDQAELRRLGVQV